MFVFVAVLEQTFGDNVFEDNLLQLWIQLLWYHRIESFDMALLTSFFFVFCEAVIVCLIQPL